MRIHESETNKCKKKLMLESKEFEQGIEFALANGCDGLQIRNTFDVMMDFQTSRKSCQSNSIPIHNWYKFH